MRAFAVIAAVTSTLLVTAPIDAGAPKASNSARERLDVYAGQVSSGQIAKIVALGIDRHELDVAAANVTRGGKPLVRVEAILTGRQVAALPATGST